MSSNRGNDYLHSAVLRSTGKDTERVLESLMPEVNKPFAPLGVTASVTYRQGPVTLCFECRKAIDGPAVKSMGNTYHAACFTCFKCHAEITTSVFAVRNDKPWCDKCDQAEKKARAGGTSSGAGGAPSGAPSGAHGSNGAHPSSSSSSSSSSHSSSSSSSASSPSPPSRPGGLTANERNEFLHNRDLGKAICAACSKPIGEVGVQDSKGALYHSACYRCSGCGAEIGSSTSYVMHENKPMHSDCFTMLAAPKCAKCFKPLVGKFVKAEGKQYHKECFTCVMCKGGLDGGYVLRKDMPYCGACAAANPLSATTTVGSSSTTSTHYAGQGIRVDPRSGKVTKVPYPEQK